MTKFLVDFLSESVSIKYKYMYVVNYNPCKSITVFERMKTLFKHAVTSLYLD